METVPGGAGVAVLGSLVDVVHIIDAKLCRLHLLPARGEPLPLQGVAPVRGVGVVVDVVLPAADGPVHGPAGRKGEVLSRQAGQVPQGLGLDPTYAFPTQTFCFSGGEKDVSKHVGKEGTCEKTTFKKGEERFFFFKQNSA